LLSGVCAHVKIGNLIGAWRVFKLSAFIDVEPKSNEDPDEAPGLGSKQELG